ncbi:MAG: hypothetical protein K2W96_23880 [Gemmataceae bacterium]|nr:hypothetical protein [Gemmataceae bacterium]
MHPSRHDPFHPPDWRSRRCEDLIARRKRPSLRHDDRWTRRWWEYFRAIACADTSRQRRVRVRHPDLAAAQAIRDGDDFVRWHMEARLLSREPVEAVARRFGLTAGAVEAYCALWFDVVPSLAARYWITFSVIGLDPARTPDEKDARLWMLFHGYHGGPLALDAFVRYFSDPEPIPESLDGLDAARLARLKLHLLTRISILGRCIRDDEPRLLLLDVLQRYHTRRREKAITRRRTAGLGRAVAKNLQPAQVAGVERKPSPTRTEV